MIRVLVVEDTPVVREFLVHILSSDPAIRVVGTAGNGEEALEAVERNKPDLITMDIHMPKLNGLDATRRIMETHPTPIVIVSGSSNPKEVGWTFRALEAGALAAVPRPSGLGHPDHEATAAELLQTVKLMSEVKVVRRWARLRRDATPVAAAPPPEDKAPRAPGEASVVAMGASTGGPPALQKILSVLPPGFPAPVLVVQHISPGFIGGFAEWLQESCALPIHVPAQGEEILPGHVYLAPDGFHMRVEREGKLSLTKDPPENGHRPSVSCLFRSVADAFGEKAVGVLLTGMGKDGAEELKLMKDKGAITIAQDKESSVVHGMPGEAIEREAATYVLAPERIAAVLAGLVNQRKKVVS